MRAGPTSLARFIVPGFLMLVASLWGALAEEVGADSALPSPVDESQWEPLRAQSPFTRTLFLSESLILTGVAEVDGQPVATLMDTEAAESIAVSKQPSERGWKLVEMSGWDDIETAMVVIAVESGESIKVRYD